MDLTDSSVFMHQNDRVVESMQYHVDQLLLREDLIRQMLGLYVHDLLSFLVEGNLQEVPRLREDVGSHADVVEHHVIDILVFEQLAALDRPTSV